MNHGLGEKITFRCTASDTTPIFISGSIYELGNWNPDQAVAMQQQQSATGAGEWTLHMDLQHGATVEFKFLKKTAAGINWERGDNRRFTIIPGAHTLSDSFRE